MPTQDQTATLNPLVSFAIFSETSLTYTCGPADTLDRLLTVCASILACPALHSGDAPFAAANRSQTKSS